MITEAEKSQNLPSASWRHRKANSVIQSKSIGLRIREAADGLNPSLRARDEMK